MGNVNDAANMQRDAVRQWELLNEAEIGERDRDAIEKWVNHRKAHGAKHGDYATGTERADLNKTRLCAERAAVPLVEMGIDDVNELINTLTRPKDAGGYGVTTGIDGYTRALRPFFRWLHKHDDFGEPKDRPWWDEIVTGNVEFDEPSDRRFPTREEIDAMVEEARANQSPRDVAILSFYRDTAVRRTLGAQLRVDDLHSLDSTKAYFTPNPEGEAQKGVEIKPYPTYAVAPLRTWVRQWHPHDPDDDPAPEGTPVPLWTAKRKEYYRRRDPTLCHRCGLDDLDGHDICPDCEADDNRGGNPIIAHDGSIGASHIREIIKKYGERAGLDPDEVELKTHAFRHAAVGRWKERRYSLAMVQRRTAWKDKAAAELWARYGDPDDAKIDDAIDELEGREPADDVDDVGDGDGADAPTPDRRTCGNCGDQGITSDHCPTCGAPVSPEARAMPGLTEGGNADASTALDPRPCWNCSGIVTGEDYCPNCGEPQTGATRIHRHEALTRVAEAVAEDPDDSEKTVTRAAVLEVVEDPEFWQIVDERLEAD